ncbi:MAG TPA: hypothetical protein V6D08_04200, partial [Candidatus Obscuribacterales bacterium]
MRIALLTTAFPPEGTNGGLASFYAELARSLHEAGHRVMVGTLSSTGDGEENREGIRIVRRQ